MAIADPVGGLHRTSCLLRCTWLPIGTFHAGWTEQCPLSGVTLSPLPRRSGWAYSSLCSPSGISLPRKGCRVGLRIVLFEDCSAFTRVTACTLALSPIRVTLIEGFSHFVTSMTAPIASGWSVCRVGLAPTGKRRLLTAHTHKRHQAGERRHRPEPRCSDG
jgi:hypothetical protein